MDRIRLTIDGKEVVGREGQTILEVASENDIRIPHLCYHPKLSKTGACRLCIVRINGKMLKASCTETAMDNMDVVTEDDGIKAMRKWLLEILLMEGDHNCLYCDADGDCELQRYVNMYEVEPSTEEFIKNEREVDYVTSNAIKRNENRCILCGRCVRACKEIQVSNVWGFCERGSQTHLIADDDKKNRGIQLREVRCLCTALSYRRAYLSACTRKRAELGINERIKYLHLLRRGMQNRFLHE